MELARIHSARVAAVVAGLGLVASAFAPLAYAQTTTTSTSMTFTRDLTIGSTGADVTALQNWLIGRGHSIAAGATGYFGAQTRAALAAWQAANGVSPASGYFGPITRVRLGATLGGGTSGGSSGSGTNGGTSDRDRDTDNDRDDDELSIDVEIRSGRAYVEAEVDGDGESFTLRTTTRSQIIREVAQRLDLDESEVRDVIRIETDDDDAGSAGADTDRRSSARAYSVDGADNDYAVFEMRVRIEAFGDDMYIPRNGGDAFAYQIENASTGATIGATTQSATVSSTADTDGSFYVIQEGEEEEFTFTVNVNPLPQDEGQSLRLQLLSIAFGESAGSIDQTLTLRPTSSYESEPVYVAD